MFRIRAFDRLLRLSAKAVVATETIKERYIHRGKKFVFLFIFLNFIVKKYVEISRCSHMIN